MIHLNIICIFIILVIAIDILRFMDSVKVLVKKILKIPRNNEISLKPFDCSSCSGFWCSLIYLICIGHVTIFNICFCILLSCFTLVIANTILLIKDVVCKFIDKIYDLLKI